MAEKLAARLTREESQARTREKIVEAARALVAQRGLGGASIRDVAAAAGFSQGAFYSNFASKEAVLLELMRRHMAEEAASLDRILVAADGSGERALAALRDWAATINQDADWAMLAIELQLHANRDAAFREAYEALGRDHRRALGRAIARLFTLLGVPAPADPEELALAYMALAHGLALQRDSAAPDPVARIIMLFTDALAALARKRGGGTSRAS